MQARWLGRPRWSRHRAREHQRGQALLEWLVAAALALLAAIWAASEFAQKAEVAAVQGYGQWLQAVSGAISDVMKHDDAGTHPSAGLLGQLPVNALAPVEPWLERLKQGGWLASALVAKPALPYEVRLLRLQPRDRCADDQCPMMVLVLALPRTDRQVPHPSAMLAALDGKGLAVTGLAPDRLQGATYQLSNPLTGELPLPLGTVGLLAWHSDRLAPYVRLNESRPVTLAGGARFGQLDDAASDCQPDGLVMLDPSGELRVCRAGLWQRVGQPHDHVRACEALAPDNQALLDLQRNSRLWPLLNPDSICQCPSGFAAAEFGRDLARVGQVDLLDGYACLRL